MSPYVEIVICPSLAVRTPVLPERYGCRQTSAVATPRQVLYDLYLLMIEVLAVVFGFGFILHFFTEYNYGDLAL